MSDSERQARRVKCEAGHVTQGHPGDPCGAKLMWDTEYKPIACTKTTTAYRGLAAYGPPDLDGRPRRTAVTLRQQLRSHEKGLLQIAVVAGLLAFWASARASEADRTRERREREDRFLNTPDPPFATCTEALVSGFGPYVEGVDAEYLWYWDKDGDGVVCEAYNP